jgi:hypothetical protein
MTKVKHLIEMLKQLDPEEPIVFDYYTPSDFIDNKPTDDEFITAARLTEKYLFDGAFSILEDAIAQEQGELN